MIWIENKLKEHFEENLYVFELTF